MHDFIAIGGGAAGFFAAINTAIKHPTWRIAIIEKTLKVLSKVRISGGGRCNVTHACFEPLELVKNYPRGSKELIGSFTRFQPKDTIAWFEERGIALKTEEDGRMFPVTDSSETIISCFMQLVKKLKIELITGVNIEDIEKNGNHFVLNFNTSKVTTRNLLLATGSQAKGYRLAEKMGHKIVPPVPSLFTFNVPSSPLLDLAGIAVNPVEVAIKKTNLKQKGPLLITHWGFSGPAVLKLSAFGARILSELEYQAVGSINWIPTVARDDLIDQFSYFKKNNPGKKFQLEELVSLPKNLLKRLSALADIPAEIRYAELSKLQIEKIVNLLLSYSFEMQGKTTYKQEFVTSGGVCLKEIDFKTMESKLIKRLYFAGEILDIDGITGGFNFQNAWTSAWLVAQNLY